MFYKEIWENKIAKFILFVALFLILLISADTYIVWYRISTENREDLANLKSCVEDFMIINEGVFPKSEDELIEKGILVKRNDIMLTDKYLYYYCPDIVKDAKFRQHLHDGGVVDIDNCIYLHHFEQFTVLYGAKVEDVELVDSELHEKLNGNEVLLISKRGSRYLKRKHFRKVSLELYEIMLRGN